MIVLSGLIGTAGIASLIYAMGLLTLLSRKLGAVTKMRRYYRGYYVAIVLGVCALAARLVYISGRGNVDQPATPWWGSSTFALLAYHLPLALAISISLAITWRYWSWLLRE